MLGIGPRHELKQRKPMIRHACEQIRRTVTPNQLKRGQRPKRSPAGISRPQRRIASKSGKTLLRIAATVRTRSQKITTTDRN